MFEWNYYILFCITIVTGWLSMFLRGLYTRKVPSGEFFFWCFDLLQNISCLLGISFICIFSGAVSRFSLFTVLLGVIFGMVNVFYLNLSLKSYSCGPFSYITIIISLSAIISTLSGVFFGERISLMQFIGIILMACCIILSPAKTDDTKKEFNVKWLVLSLGAMIFGGLVGVIQKIHQSSDYHNEEMAALLIIGFFISSAFSAIKFVSVSSKIRKETPEKSIKFPKCTLLIPIACGIAFAFPHTINLYLVGKFPAVIFFPIVNIAPMVLSILSSVVFFKERLSLKSWIGIVVGAISGVFLSGII